MDDFVAKVVQEWEEQLSKLRARKEELSHQLQAKKEELHAQSKPISQELREIAIKANSLQEQIDRARGQLKKPERVERGSSGCFG